MPWVSDLYGASRYALRWSGFALMAGLLIGSMVAWFLLLLDAVIALHWQHPEWLYGLPAIGALIYAFYHYGGTKVAGNHDMLLLSYHDAARPIPLLSAPMVMCTTLLTHLGGGSAGREGTAVLMGGAITSMLGRWCRMKPEDAQISMLMGMAAGFGAVFGTPVAGAIFALEVVMIGHMAYRALVPCLLSALVADYVCMLWEVSHTHYPQLAFEAHAISTIPLVIGFALLCGLVARLFAASCRSVKHLAHRMISKGWLVPVIGGVVIILLTIAFDTRDYLSLGVDAPPGGNASILAAFDAAPIPGEAWAMKTLYTAITLGTGFKGGEVTPLFYIGATFGHMVASLADLPIPLYSALGFLAVFAAATNTPLACMVMGVELFGGEGLLYYALVCVMANLFSGHRGIYAEQRVHFSKYDKRS